MMGVVRSHDIVGVWSGHMIMMSTQQVGGIEIYDAVNKSEWNKRSHEDNC